MLVVKLRSFWMEAMVGAENPEANPLDEWTMLAARVAKAFNIN